MATHHSKLNSSPVPPPAVLSPIQPHPRSLTYQCYPDKHIPWSLTQLCYHPYNHTPGPSPSSVIQTTTPLVLHLAVLSRQPYSQVPYPAVLSPGYPHPRSLSSVIIHTTTPLVPHSSLFLPRQPHPLSLAQQCYYPDNHSPGPSPSSVIHANTPWSLTHQCYNPDNHTHWFLTQQCYDTHTTTP